MPTIEFHYENDFRINDSADFLAWIEDVVVSENGKIGDINYIFCNDDYLSRMHRDYLDKDDLTDIITFDYVDGNTISGDIFISTERVMENATIFQETFKRELLRVMSHGLLHLLGYKDKTEDDVLMMRKKEEEKISMFHVEQ